MESVAKENAEDLFLAIDKAIRDIYVEHSHVCNIVFYIGVWIEYEKIRK